MFTKGENYLKYKEFKFVSCSSLTSLIIKMYLGFCWYSSAVHWKYPFITI